ncbi:hypothetical protein SAMN04488004_13015 [Loktanella salsilacus]|jgi:hypothetical protein|uniref:Ribbon-helix-helix protein, copG family n=1 Tax=Loktanella salsilacus TaxID=195913 RepID=A0A1I4IXS6_9RHOB|nr:hypothetical protein SAMN04488004_13015 [Loktanella salsilacus]
MGKMGRPKTDTMSINVRLSQATIDQIDTARRKETDPPTRPEQIRRIIEDWLVRNPQD